MKIKIAFIVVGLLFIFSSFAELPYGAHAENWMLSEIPSNCDPGGTWGPTWDLYADVLDQGKHAVIDFSAVWCGPCWSYHNAGILETLWDEHGSDGDNTIRVFYIEIDCETNTQCLCGNNGCNDSSQGDWTAGTNYPIFNPSDNTCSTISSDYGVTYFPTLYAINAEHKTVWEVGQKSVSEWESWLFESFELKAPYSVTDDACATNEGSIDLMPTGGFGTLSFLWSHGPTTEDVYNLSPGTYSVVITDQNGYFIEVDIVVGGNTDPLVVVNEDINHNLCYGYSDGEIFMSVSGGQGTYDYLWSNGAITEDIDNLEAGDYTLSVSDGLCTVEMTIIVTEPNKLEISYDVFDATCGEDNGSIILSAQGGTPPYKFSIGGSYSSQSSYYDIPAGFYNISVLDNNNCEIFEEVEVKALPEPVSDAGEDKEISCGNSSIQLDGSGSSSGTNFSYIWTTSNGSIISGETTLTPTVDAIGTYQLEVTDGAYSCVSIDETVVTGSGGLPSIVIATPDIITCDVNTSTLDASQSDTGADFIQEWTTTDGNIVSGEDTFVATVDQAGTYTYTLTNTESGCTSNRTVEVFEDVAEPIFTINDGILDCNNSSVQLCVAVTSDYESIIWTASGTNSECIEVAITGDYEVIVTGTNGCTKVGTASVTGNPNAPLVIINAPGTLACEDTSIDLDASSSTVGADITYLWTSIDGNFTSRVDEAITTVNQAGTYTLLVTNTTNGCSNTNSVEVLGGETIPDAKYNHDVDYNVVNLYGISTSGATSTWASEGMTATGDTVSMSFNDNGDYEVCHYLENGCGVDTTCLAVYVTAILPLSFVETSEDISCIGANDGNISVAPYGGIDDYTISWNGPNGYSSTVFDINDLTKGDYIMDLQDSGNHSITKTITISEPNSITLTALIIGTNGSLNDGSINVTISGGTPPYSFDWSNGSTDKDQKDLAESDYTLIVTDANGCTYTETYSVKTTATNDPSFINKFEIYPNPTMDYTKVNMEFSKKVEGILQLIDFSGKVIKSYDISDKERLINIDIKSLKQGVYLLKLQSQNKVGIRKLIKL